MLDPVKPAVGVDEELRTELRADGELAVIGPIDTRTVDRFRLQVLERHAGGRNLTVDLDPVSVFSSSAGRTLYELRRGLPNLRLHAVDRRRSGAHPDRSRRGARRRNRLPGPMAERPSARPLIPWARRQGVPAHRCSS